MEVNASMAWRNWCNFNGYYSMPIMNIGGMQLLKISSYDTSEKILPKSKEISKKLITVYISLTFLCAFFIKFLE